MGFYSVHICVYVYVKHKNEKQPQKYQGFFILSGWLG